MAVNPKVVTGFSLTFVCKMGAGPNTNLYNIGGDPLTQLNIFNNLFLKCCLQKKRDSEKMNGKHLCNQSNIAA